jgi:hypothetical protein
MNLKYWIDYIYAFLPKTYSRVETSNTYKIITTIANELWKTFIKKENVKSQVPIITATGISLDRHGEQFGLNRYLNESDDSFRQRILDSFVKAQLTKQNIKIVSDTLAPELNVEVEEPIYDRWFLTELNIPTVTKIETTSSITSTTIVLSESAYEITNIWLQSDTEHSGTNYADYVIYPIINETEIILSSPLPSEEEPIEIWYKQKTGEPKYHYSWLGFPTIIYPRNLNNNLNLNDISVSPAPELKNQQLSWSTESLPGTKVQILYFNSNYLIQHSWQTTVDINKNVIINNRNKTSEKIPEEVQQSTDFYTLTTNFPVASVESIYLETDITKSVNYAEYIYSINNNTIILKQPLPTQNSVVLITYTEDIGISYSNLATNMFLLTGEFDPKNTVYVWTQTDSLLEENVITLSNVIYGNTAAGVLILIGISSKYIYYGDFFYGMGYYGGITSPSSLD